MDLYLEKTTDAGVTPLEVDEVKLASDMIALIESGCPADYALKCKDLEEGDELNRAHVTSIAQARQGVECPVLARKIYDEIIAESNTLKNMRPTEFSTQTAFLAAMTEKTKHLSADTALAKLKAYEEVTTWTALKELYPTPVVKVTEPVEVLEK